MSTNDLNVAYVTAGGAGMYCGSCMRDNTLAAALHRQGVPITLVPTFTPIRTDEDDVSVDRVFLGGVNVYLDHKGGAWRGLLRPLRRALDHPALLRAISKLSLQSRRSDDGKVAVELLRGEDGPHRAAIDDLVSFIVDTIQPDIVNATNLLIAGFTRALKQRRDIPVVVTLQGDDIFLDGLPVGDRNAVVTELRRVANDVDAFITFSDDYAMTMSALLHIPREKIHVVPLGIAEPEAFAPPASPAPTERSRAVGYLGRICPEKGFDRLVDGFLRLRRFEDMQDVRLRVAGWLGASDRPFFERQCRRLVDAGAGHVLDHIDVPDRAAKAAFLHALDVFSLPTTYREPKGLTVLEALAAGVPVVQPAHGAFPELLASTGGGVLVEPGAAEAWASAVHDLLQHPDRARELGEQGRRGVLDRHRETHMADATLAVWRRVATAARRL